MTPMIDGMIMTMRDLVRKVEGGYGDAGRIRSMLDRTTDVVLLIDGFPLVHVCAPVREKRLDFGVAQLEKWPVP